MKLFSLELKSKLNRNLFRAKKKSWRDEEREKFFCKCQTDSFFHKVIALTRLSPNKEGKSTVWLRIFQNSTSVVVGSLGCRNNH